MKRYNNFIKEDLEQIKNNIADEAGAGETGKDELAKMEVDEKPNEDITQSVESTIENLEKQKQNIVNKIELFNKQILAITSSKSEDPQVAKQQENLQEMVTKLEEELKKFDDQISKSQEQKDSLETK